MELKTSANLPTLRLHVASSQQWDSREVATITFHPSPCVKSLHFSPFTGCSNLTFPRKTLSPKSKSIQPDWFQVLLLVEETALPDIELLMVILNGLIINIRIIRSVIVVSGNFIFLWNIEGWLIYV